MAMAGLENVAIYGRFRSSPAEVLGPELAVTGCVGLLVSTSAVGRWTGRAAPVPVLLS